MPKKLRPFAVALCLVLLALLIGPQLALADIAPPEPPVGSALAPEGEVTQVRMLAETVKIEVSSVSDYATGHAGVSADFTMRNLGTEAEQMDVRFPLCFNSHALIDGLYYYYPPVADFRVWVDGKEAGVTYQDEELYNPKTAADTSVACWAHFPVTFPAGQDVDVRVRYTQQGYAGLAHGIYDTYIQYNYILFTGAGWKDTIGSAEIEVHLPMPVSELTVLEMPDESEQVDAQTLRWRYTDFEPVMDYGSNGVLRIAILQPKYYYQLMEREQAVAADPEDGDAWGFLAKSYKQLVMRERGMDDRPIGAEYFQKSVQAYQQALALKPEDVDWHYGYAELLCQKAYWSAAYTDIPDNPEKAVIDRTCADELNFTLEMKPDHTGAQELLSMFLFSDQFKVQDGRLIYLELSPTPTRVTAKPANTPAPTQTARPSRTPLLASATSPAASASAQPSLPAVATNTPLPATAAADGPGWIIWGLPAALLLGAGAIWFIRRRQR
jgi:LPXTG-motif cell wall-anchored protein